MARNDKGQWALSLLRVVLGVIFLAHGYIKLFLPGGFKGTITFLTTLGFPVPVYSALLVSVVEFVGGALLLLGLLTKWTSAVLIIEMLVALFTVHLKQGFFISPQAYGYEFVLLILASLVVVFANGSGAFSLGRNYFKSRQLQ